MRELSSMISNGLWEALHAHATATGEPIRHIVSAALAQHLDIAHRTMFQVSTSSALVEGVYEGAVTVGLLKRHGNLGLGTFEQLDGEMVLLDDACYQIKSDGLVYSVPDNALTPFAAVTDFEPDEVTILEKCDDLSQLTACLDNLRMSDNIFYAIRIDGAFDTIKTRAMCKTEEGIPLAQAAAKQPEFEYHSLMGTLVGFWSPEYSKSFSVPGYHLHFISSDRTCGGHLLQCSGSDLKVQIEREANMHVALPETEDFMHADLTRDPSADLKFAEHNRTS